MFLEGLITGLHLWRRLAPHVFTHNLLFFYQHLQCRKRRRVQMLNVHRTSTGIEFQCAVKKPRSVTNQKNARSAMTKKGTQKTEFVHIPVLPSNCTYQVEQGLAEADVGPAVLLPLALAGVVGDVQQPAHRHALLRQPGLGLWRKTS